MCVRGGRGAQKWVGTAEMDSRTTGRWTGLDFAVGGIWKVSLTGGGVIILWSKGQWWFGERLMAMGS